MENRQNKKDKRRIFTKEHCKNLSRAIKKTFKNGRKSTIYWLGKKKIFTKNHKKNMKLGAIERWKNPEERKKQSKRCKGKILSIKTKKKISSNHANVLGNKNPNWKNGFSFEPYSFEFNKPLKESIRKRDNYTCQKCGIKQSKLTGYFKKLSIHHIDYVKENVDPRNLISLCNKCNIKVNYNRDYWYSYFCFKLKTKRRI